MSPGTKDHLDNSDEEHSSQRDGASQGGELLREERTQTRIQQRDEGRRKKMHETRGEQDAGAEMARGEEDIGGNAEAGKADREDGEGAWEIGESEDDKYGADVEWEVVI